jgi:hypothetical protein
MKRRDFVTSAASAAALAGPAAADPAKPMYYHLIRLQMRTGTQFTRTSDYLNHIFLPAARRAGVGPVGFFSPVIGERSPFVLSLVTYPALSAMETIHTKLGEDKEFLKGFDEYENIADPAYVRMESTLLRAFDGIPSIDVPPSDEKRAARIFELRTYESVNTKASQRKIKMFEDGEAGIFRRLGMSPVFFGRSIIGPNQPSLTYMLAYDDLAARDRLWRAFGSDPEWQKLRSQPGLSDAEIVSNISNEILRPLPFSPIR